MRRPTSFDKGRKPLTIEMAPMIDVVFLLLVYFLWTLSFAGLVSEQVAVKGTPTETAGTAPDPNEPPPVEADFKDIVVRIVDESGKRSYEINKKPFTSLAEVQQRLTELAAIKTDVPVIVDPAPEVKLGEAFDVYDLARRKVGFEVVQFAAEKGDAG